MRCYKDKVATVTKPSQNHAKLLDFTLFLAYFLTVQTSYPTVRKSQHPTNRVKALFSNLSKKYFYPSYSTPQKNGLDQVPIKAKMTRSLSPITSLYNIILLSQKRYIKYIYVH